VGELAALRGTLASAAAEAACESQRCDGTPPEPEQSGSAAKSIVRWEVTSRRGVSAVTYHVKALLSVGRWRGLPGSAVVRWGVPQWRCQRKGALRGVTSACWHREGAASTVNCAASRSKRRAVPRGRNQWYGAVAYHGAAAGDVERCKSVLNVEGCMEEPALGGTLRVLPGLWSAMEACSSALDVRPALWRRGQYCGGRPVLWSPVEHCAGVGSAWRRHEGAARAVETCRGAGGASVRMGGALQGGASAW
jgi:hypothetical protein